MEDSRKARTATMAEESRRNPAARVYLHEGDEVYYRRTGAPRHRPLDRGRMKSVLRAEGGLIGVELCDPTQVVCGHAGRCAIGALLFALGAREKDLAKHLAPWDTPTRARLYNAYGLTRPDVDLIMTRNDGSGSSDPAERLDHVLGVIERLSDERLGLLTPTRERAAV